MWLHDEYTSILENPSWVDFDLEYVSPFYDTLILTASLFFWLTVSNKVSKCVEIMQPNYSIELQQNLVYHLTKFIYATILTPVVIQCIWENWHIFNDPFNPGEFDQRAMDIIIFSTGFTMHLWFKERQSYSAIESHLFRMDCEYLLLFIIVHMYSHQFSRLYIIYSLNIIHDFVTLLYDILMHFLPNQPNLGMRMLMSLDYVTFLVFRAFLLFSLVVSFLVENVINGMSYYNYISILHILNAMENRNMVHWVQLFNVDDALDEGFCALGMLMISYWQHKYHPEWVMMKIMCYMMFGREIWNFIQYKVMIYLPDSLQTLLMSPFEDWP